PLNPSPRWHSSSKARASTATVQVPDCRQLSAKQRQRRWRLWQFRCYFPLFITVRLLPGLYCRTNGCQGSRPTGEIAIGGSREVRIGVAKRASSQIAPRVPEGTQLLKGLGRRQQSTTGSDRPAIHTCEMESPLEASELIETALVYAQAVELSDGHGRLRARQLPDLRKQLLRVVPRVNQAHVRVVETGRFDRRFPAPAIDASGSPKPRRDLRRG